ncbi:4'-phosphopantetheinyl transferase domain-containing protein [Dioscorea alata]|uniref:4'-phosphopantetheinyl transferase domain-containing protein n=3 Tax=Dioscorea alata TaxID=55571 RepID=A0ACB7U6X5_DIOAL|nr:4'-phosphopantetheinyl transferase domain-containing protein [Dioscorea alata]KAH7656021.1 4'-phosphopantetheinyl transferase domain-containing protein [Dioscorea alata]KAH7656022.1 4'-phosphopantetheinyl transferase domain-containing protein [Dioscorea alata]
MQYQICFFSPFKKALKVGILALFCGSLRYWGVEVLASSCWKDICIVFLMVLAIFLGLRGQRCPHRSEELKGVCSHCVHCSSCQSMNQSCDPCKKEDNSESEEALDGTEEDIVMKLKEEIAREKELRNALELELERERTAASWAADEALAKISRLQSEKWRAEMEANQERIKAELNQLSYLHVIESLYGDLKTRGMNEDINSNHLDS